MTKAKLELNEDESVFVYDAIMLQLPLEEHKNPVNPESMSEYRADCLREIMLRIKAQWEERDS